MTIEGRAGASETRQ